MGEICANFFLAFPRLCHAARIANNWGIWGAQNEQKSI